MTAIATQKVLPHWDMTPYYASLDSPDFERDFTKVVTSIGALRELFDARGIRRRDDRPLEGADVEAFEAATRGLNELWELLQMVQAFIYSYVTTDSRDDAAQARLSELQREFVELSRLGTRYRAWLGSLDVEALIERSPLAREHAFAVTRAKEGALYLMSEVEEDLAAGLQPSGQSAWAKLHGNVTSLMAVEVTKPGGKTEKLPMSTVRGLARDQDPGVRRAAYEAEIAAWDAVAVPLAAALNSIKGAQNTLNERRGWKDSLDPALFGNNVDRETLEAMQAACVESFPDFRRYLRAKARLLGSAKLPWWDLFAPVGEGARTWEYEEAADFIVRQFGTYSDRMAGLAGRAFGELWIDAEPRMGKRDGGFCMGVRKEESRILVNYEPSFVSVSTIAHELGHAYHNINLAQRTPLQRQTPSALAETASIFCETIVNSAMIAESEGAERLAILEHDLHHGCQIVVDIHSRFLFEKTVFEGRERRELSVAELKDQMLDAQRRTYGDGLDPEALHPFMWAVKGHYYGPSYYNWPYTFGMLFGLGLYTRYTQDPDGFRAGYDDLLSSTGLGDAAALAARFGIDVRSTDFWRSSLDVVRARIDEFEGLVG